MSDVKLLASAMYTSQGHKAPMWRDDVSGPARVRQRSVVADQMRTEGLAALYGDGE